MSTSQIPLIFIEINSIDNVSMVTWSRQKWDESWSFLHNCELQEICIKMFGIAQLAGAHCYVHIDEPCKSEKRAFLMKGYAVSVLFLFFVCFFCFFEKERDLEKIGNRISVCHFCVTTILQGSIENEDRRPTRKRKRRPARKRRSTRKRRPSRTNNVCIDSNIICAK